MRGSNFRRRVGLALAGMVLMANAPLEDAQRLMQEGKAAEAFAIVEQAAADGDAAAIANLGWFYDEGHAVAVDKSRAAELYRQAADLGNAFARWRLGVMIDERLAPGDTDDAVLLFKQAVHQGNTNAMTSLAVMYAMGRGVEQDFDQARMHYEMAARLGNPHAFQGLGVLYANGEGVGQDLDEATAYWLIASQLGHEGARQRVNSLLSQMNAEARERLVARANELLEEMGIGQSPTG